MNLLIFIVLLIGAGIGFYQGAFKQIAHLCGVILGLILASMLYRGFGDFLATASSTSSSIGRIFAFVIIFLLVPIVLGWIASLLTKAFESVHLGFVNRICGAAIGVVSYTLLLSAVFNFYDFVESSCGYHTENLGERPASFYIIKQTAQFIVPDIIIVTDATEEANGAKPMRGIKTSVENAVDKAVDSAFGEDE